MTSSARFSTIGGMVSPMALALRKLMTSSNLVGCSMGRSPGLAPLAMLVDVGRGAAEQIYYAHTVAHETAVFHIIRRIVHRRNAAFHGDIGHSCSDWRGGKGSLTPKRLQYARSLQFGTQSRYPGDPICPGLEAEVRVRFPLVPHPPKLTHCQGLSMFRGRPRGPGQGWCP